jgi:hypothetical protein
MSIRLIREPPTRPPASAGLSLPLERLGSGRPRRDGRKRSWILVPAASLHADKKIDYKYPSSVGQRAAATPSVPGIVCLASSGSIVKVVVGIELFPDGTVGTPIDRGTLPRWRLTKLEVHPLSNMHVPLVGFTDGLLTVSVGDVCRTGTTVFLRHDLLANHAPSSCCWDHRPSWKGPVHPRVIGVDGLASGLDPAPRTKRRYGGSALR